jgi:hypothetical protein
MDIVDVIGSTTLPESTIVWRKIMPENCQADTRRKSMPLNRYEYS